MNEQENEQYNPITDKRTTHDTEAEDELIKFDPMTGKPLGITEKKQDSRKGRKVLIGGILTIGVITAIVFAGIKSGIFLNKHNKILAAAVNTMKKSHLVKTLDISDITGTGKYTVSLECFVEYFSLNSNIMVNAPEKKKSLNGRFQVLGILNAEFTAIMDEESLQLQIPMFRNRDIYSYNFINEKTGYIKELLSEEAIETIDQIALILNSEKTWKEMIEKSKEALLKEYNRLDFKKLQKKEIIINEKVRKCTGYGASITSEFIINLFDIICDLYDKYYGDEEDIYNEEGIFNIEIIKDSINNLKNEINQMEDIDLRFYLYKNRLASIYLEMEEEIFEIQFLGGDVPAQNIKVIRSGDIIFEMKGQTQEFVEKLEFIYDKKTLLEYEYNYKNNDIQIRADFFGKLAEIEGSLASDRNSVTFVCDKIIVPENSVEIDTDLTLRVFKGAEIKELDGVIIDIGSASRWELEDLYNRLELENLYSKLESLMKYQ